LRTGRPLWPRPVLMVNILSFSVIELACASRPRLARCWCCARSLAWHGWRVGRGRGAGLRDSARRGRGGFSGILQEGYALGSILAAGIYALFFHAIGWRGLFILGATPALLVFYVQARVLSRRSGWKETQAACLAVGGVRPSRLSTDWAACEPSCPPSFPCVVDDRLHELFARHQDVYPTFLATQARLTPQLVGLIACSTASVPSPAELYWSAL